MHEIETAKEMLRLAIGAAKKDKAKRILRIVMKIGMLSSMMPEYIQYYFKEISHNTMAAGAIIEIERIPLVMECLECGFSEVKERLIFKCSKCCKTNLKIVSGMELELDSIEIE